MERKIRILMAKPGLDGHDRGIKVLAAAYRDAGMEVIYLGLRQTPEMIVSAALQEDADVIALSSLNNAHMTIFPNVYNLMQEKGLSDVLLTGGGIITQKRCGRTGRDGHGQAVRPRYTGPGYSGLYHQLGFREPSLNGFKEPHGIRTLFRQSF